MAALIPNIAKGKYVYYAGLPAASDKLVWVLFSGTETDDNIRDAASLTAVIATVLDEATFTGYARVDAGTTTITVDNANNWTTVSTANPVWNPVAAQVLTRIGLFYDPDSSNTAANMIPLFVDDFSITTPTSGTLTYQVASGGWGKAS